MQVKLYLFDRNVLAGGIPVACQWIKHKTLIGLQECTAENMAEGKR